MHHRGLVSLDDLVAFDDDVLCVSRVDGTANVEPSRLAGRLARSVETVLQPIATDLHVLGRRSEDAGRGTIANRIVLDYDASITRP